MRYKINLIEQKEKNLADKIVYFALNYLRYILVITQLIVIGVFFYRFSIDQQIIDTDEAVQQKEEIILVSQPLIKQIDSVSFYIENSQNILDEQTQVSQMMNYFLSVFPKGLILDNLTIDINSLLFEGSASDILLLQQFYNRLIRDGRFGEIKLNNIDKDAIGVSFSFNLNNYFVKK